MNLFDCHYTRSFASYANDAAYMYGYDYNIRMNNAFFVNSPLYKLPCICLQKAIKREEEIYVTYGEQYWKYFEKDNDEIDDNDSLETQADSPIEEAKDELQHHSENSHLTTIHQKPQEDVIDLTDDQE